MATMRMGPVPPRPSRRGQAVTMPAQARTAEQQSDLGVQYACSKCAISYHVQRGQKAQCPLCVSERRNFELQAAMNGQRNELERLHDEVTRLQVAVDLIAAMRDALSTIGVDDLTFLKSVLYRYRAEKGSIQLRATHGQGLRRVRQQRGGTDQPAVNGYLVETRNGEPEAHLCSSIGGVAIASYYQEAVRTSGAPQALATLMRALGPTLTADTSGTIGEIVSE